MSAQLSCPAGHASGRPSRSTNIALCGESGGGGFENERETRQKAQRSRECIKKGEIVYVVGRQPASFSGGSVRLDGGGGAGRNSAQA